MSVCVCVCPRASQIQHLGGQNPENRILVRGAAERGEGRGGVGFEWLGGGETRTDTILFRVRGRLRKGKISRNVSKVHIDTHIGDSNDKVTHKGQINQPVRTTLSLY